MTRTIDSPTTITVHCPPWCTADHTEWSGLALEHSALVRNDDGTDSPVTIAVWDAAACAEHDHLALDDCEPRIILDSAVEELTFAGAKLLASAMGRAVELFSQQAPTRNVTVTFAPPSTRDIRALIDAGRFQLVPFGTLGVALTRPPYAHVLDAAGVGKETLLIVAPGLSDEVGLTDRVREIVVDPANRWEAGGIGENWTVDLPALALAEVSA